MRNVEVTEETCSGDEKVAEVDLVPPRRDNETHISEALERLQQQSDRNKAAIRAAIARA